MADDPYSLDEKVDHLVRVMRYALKQTDRDERLAADLLIDCAAHQVMSSGMSVEDAGERFASKIAQTATSLQFAKDHGILPDDGDD